MADSSSKTADIPKYYNLQLKRIETHPFKAFLIQYILKSRDIALSTKVHLVKAMVFPVVMYGCESWTVKKDERQRIDILKCGVGEDS